jgi:putative ABC transport system substrate-binding protein
MRRRDFIAGAVAASAIGRAKAQQKTKVYRMAIVTSSGPVGDLTEMGRSPAFRAFFQRLRQLGYIEGQNLAVERYSVEGRTERYAELVIPAASRVAYLAPRTEWESAYGPALQEAAQRNNMSLIGPPLDVPFDEAEYRRVFAAMAQAGADAVAVDGRSENLTNRRLIVELAEQARLPAIYTYPDFTDIGGLMAYGVDLRDILRHAADQIDMIFKGTKPAEIPFYQPTKFTLTINLKAAKALGITVPPTLLIAADEVIE